MSSEVGASGPRPPSGPPPGFFGGDALAGALPLRPPLLGPPPTGPPPTPTGAAPALPYGPPPSGPPPNYAQLRPPQSKDSFESHRGIKVKMARENKSKAEAEAEAAAEVAASDRGDKKRHGDKRAEKEERRERRREKQQNKAAAANTIAAAPAPDSEEARLAAELEKIRWRREVARLKRENEALKERAARDEIFAGTDTDTRGSIDSRSGVGSKEQTKRLSSSAATEVLADAARGDTGTSTGSDKRDNGGLSNVWGMLRTAVDTALAAASGAQATATPTPDEIGGGAASFPEHMLQKPSKPIVNGAMKRDGKAQIIHGEDWEQSQHDSSELLLTPLPELLSGRTTIWRMPYNGRGPAEKRVLTVALQKNSSDGAGKMSVDMGDVMDVCFMDLNKMSEARHSSRHNVAHILKLPITLQWYELRPEGEVSAVRELELGTGSSLLTGHVTKAFQKKIKKGEALPRAELCLSVVTATRSLDLAAESPHEAQAWAASLHYLLQLAAYSSAGAGAGAGGGGGGGYGPGTDAGAHSPAQAMSPIRTDQPNYPGNYPGMGGGIGMQQIAIAQPPMYGLHIDSSGAEGTPPGSPQSLPLPPVAGAGERGREGAGVAILGSSGSATQPPAATEQEQDQSFSMNNPLAKGNPLFHPKLGAPASGLKKNPLLTAGPRGPRGSPPKASIRKTTQLQQHQHVWKEKLFTAAQSGDIDAFESVLAGGAPIDTPIGSGSSSMKHVQSLGNLLQNVGSPAAWDTPLIVAARTGRINIVKACLKAGAKNDPFGEGTTALHAATAACQYDAAAVILQSAAKANASAVICAITDGAGCTPLHIAAKLGADVGKENSQSGGALGTDSQILELLISHGSEMRACDDEGRTALHLCTIAGSVQAAEALLEYDDGLVDLLDKSGCSALHIAVAANDIDMVRVLLQSAANPYLVSAKYGKNALDLAVTKSFTKVGVLLLEYRTYVDEHGLSSSAHAEEGTGKVETVKAEEEEEEPQVTLLPDTVGVGVEDWQHQHQHQQHQHQYQEEEEGGNLGEPASSFWLEGALWREYYHGNYPFYVDETGDSTWDDPRDYVAVDPDESDATAAVAAVESSIKTEAEEAEAEEEAVRVGNALRKMEEDEEQEKRRAERVSEDLAAPIAAAAVMAAGAGDGNDDISNNNDDEDSDDDDLLGAYGGRNSNSSAGESPLDPYGGASFDDDDSESDRNDDDSEDEDQEEEPNDFITPRDAKIRKSSSRKQAIKAKTVHWQKQLEHLAPSQAATATSFSESLTPPADSWCMGSMEEEYPLFQAYPPLAGEQPELYLRKWRTEDVHAYFTALEASREHLEFTLPTRAVPPSFEAAQEKIADGVRQWAAYEAFNYFIWASGSSKDSDSDDVIVGAIALFNRGAAGMLEIGYWVAKSHIRQGISTRASLVLMREAFDNFCVTKKPQQPPAGKLNLTSITIDHDKLLERSSGGVPRKLGFLREEEISYTPAPTNAPSSGILVIWAYPAERRARLDTLKIGKR